MPKSSQPAGAIFRAWRWLPAPAAIRCRTFHALPERVQRRAWAQLSRSIEEQRRAEFEAASDADSLEHISRPIHRLLEEMQ